MSLVPGGKRVLFVLKTNGPQTAVHIAKRLGVTTMAVRQHLALLEGEALVDFTHERRKVGRPIRRWRLTDKGYDLFPDRHAELAIAMLQAVGDAFGENGFERFAEALTRLQADTYRARMPPAEASKRKKYSGTTRVATIPRGERRRPQPARAARRDRHPSRRRWCAGRCASRCA